MQYETHRALRVPNLVVYSYFLDVYCNGSVASLFVGRTVKAKYVVLSLGAFVRVVQYGPHSRFAHNPMWSMWDGRGVLLQVAWVLVGQWIRYEMFSILKDMDVDPVSVILAIVRAAKADWDARLGLDWFCTR